MNALPLQYIALSAQEKHWEFHPSMLFSQHDDGSITMPARATKTPWRLLAAGSEMANNDDSGANLTWLPRQ